ncbi:MULTISPECIES: glucose 1-dehydrogenase [unclassified Ruegeria]|uniref:SDR family NAD(P)-dependent oxidoreductase n=1 Tax=unclassified Ruegeria TaxID=2625375 RepID=UPI001ADC3FB4|nr:MULTISPECIES: glucose 1-dehydrogenase [unclassified Ruegeria]MBO9412353.1 glucose 1-dehydrogenase [Ruegeria sp. R8_1]MBO9416409.1 glucose 1-dehydrogenase [Ruegeria sp. R8_2]
MARLAGKIALVTGAGSMKGGMGNGKATAIRLAQEGAAIAALDLDQTAAEETCDMIRQAGGRAFALTADVTQEDQVKTAIAQCLSEFGQIDILQNNVGILKTGGAMDSTVEDWDALVHVNMKAVFLPTKHVLPHFVERGMGVVTNISSIAGLRYLGTPYIGYNATKGSIISFTRNLAAEMAPHGVRANAILPGFIDTPMARDITEQNADDPEAIDWGALDKQRAARIPLGRVGTPWDVANAAVFLASDEASYITGTEITVDGGVSCRV